MTRASGGFKYYVLVVSPFFIHPTPPPHISEHVSLNIESLCKNMTRASGGFKYYEPLRVGVTNG